MNTVLPALLILTVAVNGLSGQEKRSQASMKKAVAVIASADQLKTFSKGLQSDPQIESFIDGEIPFTIFAPADSVFAKLPKQEVERMLGRDGFRDIGAHILLGEKIPAKKLAVLARKEASLDNDWISRVPVKFSNEKDTLLVSGAKLIQTDIQCEGGVIHIVDALIPCK